MTEPAYQQSLTSRILDWLTVAAIYTHGAATYLIATLRNRQGGNTP